VVPGGLSLTHHGRLVAFLAALAVLAGIGAAVTAVAGANSTRVSIADFKWSKDPEIKLGESVTWDFLGPDLQHSVTGWEPNSAQWDSDPDQSMPVQPLGRAYKVTFDQPGEYFFRCKIHSSVQGTVTVDNVPGDPLSDPGPQPPLNLDMNFPVLDDWFFTRDGFNPAPAVVPPTGKGIGFRFSVGERGTADVDYYRMVPRYGWKTVTAKKRVRGRNGKVRVRTVQVRKRVRKGDSRQYAGYSEWTTHVGQNLVRWARPSATLPAPEPGRYTGIFRVTDESANSTLPITLAFEVKPPRGR